MSKQHLLNPWTLLKIEYAKFKSYSVINFLFWVAIALFPVLIVAGKELITDLPDPIPSTNILVEFPTVWDYQGYIGNWLVFFFFGCITIFSITSEVNFKTQRQSIINGYTRKEYFLAKLLNVLFLSALVTAVYTLTCLVIGFIFTDDPYLSLAFDNNWAIPRFFIMSLGYMSMAMFFAMVFRRNGLAIFIYVAYVLIFEYILRGLHTFLLFKIGIPKENWKSGFYWPANIFEDNMPMPLMKLQDFIDNDMPFNFLLEPLTAFLVSVLYICIFVGLSYRSFMKNDI